MKIYCERCKLQIHDEESIREVEFEQELKDILPKGVKLYDFGNRVTSLPTPDPDGNGWLRTNIAYLTNEGFSRFLAMEIEPEDEEVYKDANDHMDYLRRGIIELAKKNGPRFVEAAFPTMSEAFAARAR